VKINAWQTKPYIRCAKCGRSIAKRDAVYTVGARGPVCRRCARDVGIIAFAPLPGGLSDFLRGDTGGRDVLGLVFQGKDKEL